MGLDQVCKIEIFYNGISLGEQDYIINDLRTPITQYWNIPTNIYDVSGNHVIQATCTIPNGKTFMGVYTEASIAIKALSEVS